MSESEDEGPIGGQRSRPSESTPPPDLAAMSTNAADGGRGREVWEQAPNAGLQALPEGADGSLAGAADAIVEAGKRRRYVFFSLSSSMHHLGRARPKIQRHLGGDSLNVVKMEHDLHEPQTEQRAQGRPAMMY